MDYIYYHIASFSHLHCQQFLNKGSPTIGLHDQVIRRLTLTSYQTPPGLFIKGAHYNKQEQLG